MKFKREKRTYKGSTTSDLKMIGDEILRPVRERKGRRMAAVAVMPKIEEQSLADKALCLNVSFGMFGNSRKVPSEQVRVDADKALIKVQKILVDSKELRDISTLDSQFKIWLQSRALPYSGVALHLIAYEAVEEVYQKCVDHEKERGILEDKFVDAYPTLCKAAQNRLGGVWNPSDYLPQRKVKATFKFTYGFVNLGTPKSLKSISMDLWRAESKKNQEVWKQAIEEGQTFLWNSFMEKVTHLKESLEPTADGKQKRLYQTTIDKVNDFLNTFDGKSNVVNSPEELRQEVAKVRKLMSGVSIEGLRTTDTLRDKIKSEMGVIAERLEEQIETRGRKFRDR